MSYYDRWQAANDKKTRYGMCAEDLDSAKFSAARAGDQALADKIQALIDDAEAKESEWSEKAEKLHDKAREELELQAAYEQAEAMENMR